MHRRAELRYNGDASKLSHTALSFTLQRASVHPVAKGFPVPHQAKSTTTIFNDKRLSDTIAKDNFSLSIEDVQQSAASTDGSTFTDTPASEPPVLNLSIDSCQATPLQAKICHLKITSTVVEPTHKQVTALNRIELIPSEARLRPRRASHRSSCNIAMINTQTAEAFNSTQSQSAMGSIWCSMVTSMVL